MYLLARLQRQCISIRWPNHYMCFPLRYQSCCLEILCSYSIKDSIDSRNPLHSIQFLRKAFSFFRISFIVFDTIEKQRMIKLSNNSCKSHDSAILSNSEETHLSEEASFHPFLYCVLLHDPRNMTSIFFFVFQTPDGISSRPESFFFFNSSSSSFSVICPSWFLVCH